MNHCPIALLLVLMTSAAPASACIHGAGGGTSTTPVSQAGQQALVLHHNGVEDLIMRIEYRGEALTHLGWVIPVPNVPTAYATAAPQLFEQLDEAVKLVRHDAPRSKSKSAGGGSSSNSAVHLLPPASAGPFRIQPIKATGAGAATALNQWMTANGFAAIPAAGLAYYVERGWTFLAVRVEPTAGKTTLSASGGLPPLRITFKTPRAVYPLKLSTHGGIFAARIYLLTDQAHPDEAFEGARARGFEVVHRGRYLSTARHSRGTLRVRKHAFSAHDAPAALRPLLSERFGDKTVRLSVLFSERVNDTGIKRWADSPWKHVRFAPAAWAEDLSVPGLKDGQRLLPTGD